MYKFIRGYRPPNADFCVDVCIEHAAATAQFCMMGSFQGIVNIVHKMCLFTCVSTGDIRVRHYDPRRDQFLPRDAMLAQY